jgi:hypothetical protein
MSEAQNPIPPPYTLYTCIIKYAYSNREGGREGGMESCTREKGGGGNTGDYRSLNWVKNTNMTECTQEIGYLQSINSDNHLPQSPFTGQFFQMTTFLHCL